MGEVDSAVMELLRAAEKLLGGAASAFMRGRDPKPSAEHMAEIRRAIRKLEELQ